MRGKHILSKLKMENLSTDYSDDYYEADEFEAKLEFLWGILPYLDNNLAEVFFIVNFRVWLEIFRL